MLLIGAWAALVVAAVAVVTAIFQGGLLLLYVAVGASALAMALSVAYLMKGSGRGGGPEPGAPGR
ncbi:MAG TPA: hypothetical protein VJ868_04675 [Actinomycetota bacterium]|nr:hypothetical protein [Actinomycetota bacterium]